MNKLILVILFSVCSLFAVEFHSFKDALKIQKKNNKVIMIKVMRNNCRYCKDMQSNVCENPEMSKWLDEHFIIVKINLDNEDAPLGIKVSFTPSFYFVDKDKNIVKKIPGAWNIEDFKDLTKGIK